MRTISFPINTYSRTLSASITIVEPSLIVPNLGPLQGVSLKLTVALAGATASQSSNTIDQVISLLQGQDQFGAVLLDAAGTDLTVLNDLLQPRGVRTSPPVVTTSAGGAGTASWSVFLPFTVGAHDMPAKLNLTWASTSVLQNAGLVAAGTVTVTLAVVGMYSTATDQPSLRVRAVNVPHASGNNNIQAYLPNGEQVEALAFVLTSDATLSYVTLTASSAFLLNQQTSDQFIQADTMLMQSGHLSGEMICRVPVFIVDSVTTLNVNLVSDSTIRLYTISTVPIKRAS